MKQFFLSMLCLIGLGMIANSQHSHSEIDTIRTILENDKMKVVEYVGTSGKGVCGKGIHSHPPHLTILLTDARIKVTTPDGKVQDFELKAGFTAWFEADTHIAINNEANPVKAYLIELKK